MPGEVVTDRTETDHRQMDGISSGFFGVRSEQFRVGLLGLELDHGGKFGVGFLAWEEDCSCVVLDRI